jgi:hypothetical protein
MLNIYFLIYIFMLKSREINRAFIYKTQSASLKWVYK